MEEDVAKQLGGYTYVLCYDANGDDVQRLMRYTDESTCCLDLSSSEELRRAVLAAYGLTALPALVYRGGVVYASDDVEAAMDGIDAANLERARRFVDAFVLPRGVSLFIKGTVEKPYCKYTKQLLAILRELGVENVKGHDILADPFLRYYLKQMNQWGTFPMVYINGEFRGGLDSFRGLVADGTVRRLLNLSDQ